MCAMCANLTEILALQDDNHKISIFITRYNAFEINKTESHFI